MDSPIESERLQHVVGVERLLSRSFANIAIIWWELALYLALYVGWLFLDPGSPGGILGMAKPIVFVGATYPLYRSILRKRGCDPGYWRVLSFVGMAALLAIPIAVGAGFFLFPGLYLITKWIAAPSYLVQGHGNIFESAGASWMATRGVEFPIGLAVAVLFIVWTFLSILLNGAIDSVPRGGSVDWQGIIGSVSLVLPLILMMGLSTACYEVLPCQSCSTDDISSPASA